MRFARKKRSRLAIELLEDRTVPATLSALADINANNPSSDPREFTQVGDSLYFSAKTEATGFELWKTDGTVEGTTLVKDIYPGAASSSPHNLQSINGKLYFAANDGMNGYELWQSDGSEEGTTRISNFSATAFFSHESPVIFANGLIYTVASGLNQEGGEGSLYVIDENTGETSLVFNAAVFKRSVALMGNSLMFIANDGTSGFEVWKLEIGTQTPIAITDLSTQFSRAFGNSNTLVADGYYFFHAANGISNGLWKTDGTPGGAELVFNPYVLPQYSIGGEFVRVGNLIYFSTYDGRTSRLYVTDGTTAGTRRIANFYGDSPSNVNSLTYFKGELYFVASNLLGPELWKTNGTAAGTTFVKPLATDGRGSNPTQLIVAGDILYFKIVPSGQSTQLARSDGAAEGTYAIATVIANEFIPFDDRLFLSQYDFRGTELWVSDGTIGPPTLF